MPNIKEQKIITDVRKDFLEESISSVIGKQGEEITSFLDSEKYVNEFLIAKKLDITINQTRNLLYKLSEHGLVSSTRKKDKRKGWYTYFWKLEALKTLEFFREILKKRISQIINQIDSREVKAFYVCLRCNIEFSEENALLNDFTCGECGNVFSLKDNTKVLKELKKNLEKQQREFNFIEEKIMEEKEKGEKKKNKEIKKEEKEKVKKKLEKKIERQIKKKKDAKEAEKNLKKTPKKSSKPVKVKSKKPSKKKK